MLETNLVISRASHVPHPLDSLVGALLVDLEESDVESGCGEGGHGEDDVDGRLRPDLVVAHLEHLDLRGEGDLLASGELAERPVDGLVLGVVGGGSEGGLGHDVGGVGRHGQLDVHVLRGDLLAEVGDHLHVDLQRGAADLLVHGEDAEGQVDVLRHAVLHQLELPVRRDERDRAVLVEAAQTHAPVERAVVDLHARPLPAPLPLRLPLVRDQQLVVQPEATLRHARQVRLHHDLPHHLAVQHRARLRDQQVHALQRVDEDLVLAVRDALATPTSHPIAATHQSIAPVTCDVMLLASSCTSSLAFPRRISCFIRSIAQFCGYP